MIAIAASPILRPEREPSSRRFWLAVAASVALHVIVLGSWLLFGSGRADKVTPPETMDVTIADTVSLVAAAPQRVMPPAQSQAPEAGTPEDSAPPPAPTPEEIAPRPAPPTLQPAPAPRSKQAELAKPQVHKAVPPVAQPRASAPRPQQSSVLAQIVGKGSGRSGARNSPRGSALGSIVNSLGTQKSPSKSPAPEGAAMNQQASMDIIRKIADQIQPCARNQSLSAPGVGKIRVVVTLSFKSDGYPSAAPKILRLDGVDDDNQRYADQVRQRALAAFQDRSCQPIHGLPPELYDVPKGWRSVTLGFKLPG